MTIEDIELSLEKYIVSRTYSSYRLRITGKLYIIDKSFDGFILWLMKNKDKPTGYTWFDEVKVSKSRSKQQNIIAFIRNARSVLALFSED